MTFNSLAYLVFFPVVSVLYFFLPHKIRWFWLLLASCYFYAAFIPVYLLVLLWLIIVDYFSAIAIERSKGVWRKVFLTLSIFSTLSVLLVFKYFDFLNTNLTNLAQFLHWNYSVKNLNLILPLGLSFHTFQSLSYVIDVYRKKQKAEQHFGIFALFVMFFPQLVAGPIERAQNLLHQFYEKHKFEEQRVTDGLKLILWGMFKKVVIADRLALVVNQVFGQPYDYAGWPLVLATVFFSFQIYCDFSGYSDIAIGSAKVLGFRLNPNFHRPYFSTSVPEFWRRWHISLSTWFRDYVYIAFGGNKTKHGHWILAVILTFFLSGVWHGANWTFVVWGLLNGAYYLLWRIGDKAFSRFPAFLTTIVTFLLITVAWIFFRAKSLPEAGYVLSHLFSPAKVSFLGLTIEEMILAFVLIGFLLCVEFLDEKKVSLQERMPAWVRWPVYVTAVLIIMNLGISVPIPFIYFQF